MAAGRSFKEFVKDKCYNDLYAAAERYVADNWESFDLYTRKIHRIGSVEMVDGRIERVYVEDRPDIEKITVYDEKLLVEFKSGLTVEVEA